MADTWTLAPVIARRAAEHPERPLVIGIPRRPPSAVQAQIAGLAGPRAEAILRASDVPYEDAGMTGGKAQAFARARLADHTPPDLDRLFDAFPVTGSGKAGRREIEREHALDSTVTSGA